MFPHEPPQTMPPLVLRKPKLPGIWQTIASSGIPVPIEPLPPAFDSPFLGAVQSPVDVETIAKQCRTQPEKKRRRFKRTLFSDSQKRILIDWLQSHQSNPYPTLLEKQELMQETGLNREQINIWFTNNRIRHGLTGIHAKAEGQHHQLSAARKRSS